MALTAWVLRKMATYSLALSRRNRGNVSNEKTLSSGFATRHD